MMGMALGARVAALRSVRLIGSLWMARALLNGKRVDELCAALV